MAHPNENEQNPYQSPMSAPGAQDAAAALAIERGIVKKFREQIHALGALWIILGLIAAVIGGLAVGGNMAMAERLGGSDQILLFIVAGMGLLWFAVGVLACLKQIAAVYVGLVLSYLSLLGQVVSFNICGIVIVILVILQAHRVISWANQMRAAGVSLTAKPR